MLCARMHRFWYWNHYYNHNICKTFEISILQTMRASWL